MVLFQNRIIYMPGVPLGAKRERIQDYKHSFFGIDWKEHRRSIKTSDGKLLSYVVGKSKQKEEEDGGVVVVYFQGYLSHFPLSSPPPASGPFSRVYEFAVHTANELNSA